MNHNFCTLFDKNYLYKGLALYNSLKKNCENFKLFILCMDDVTYSLLHKINLENVELISLKEFEDEELALKMKELLENETLRRKIANNAYETQKKYTIDKISDIYYQVFRFVLNNK